MSQIVYDESGTPICELKTEDVTSPEMEVNYVVPETVVQDMRMLSRLRSNVAKLGEPQPSGAATIETY